MDLLPLGDAGHEVPQSRGMMEEGVCANTLIFCVEFLFTLMI